MSISAWRCLWKWCLEKQLLSRKLKWVTGNTDWFILKFTQNILYADQKYTEASSRGVLKKKKYSENIFRTSFPKNSSGMLLLKIGWWSIHYKFTNTKRDLADPIEPWFRVLFLQVWEKLSFSLQNKHRSRDQNDDAINCFDVNFSLLPFLDTSKKHRLSYFLCKQSGDFRIIWGAKRPKCNPEFTSEIGANDLILRPAIYR